MTVRATQGALLVLGAAPAKTRASQAALLVLTQPATSPVITSISPPNGPSGGGTAVTITGTNFTGTTDIKFGGVSATSIVVVNSTTITCNTPAGTGVVDVDLYNPLGNFNYPASYTYTSATLTSIAPTSGDSSGGDIVTLTGTVLTGATGVKFDGVSATSVVVVNSTTVTCVTPAHVAGLVDVQIFTPAGNPTLAAAYTYIDIVSVRVTQVPLLVLDKSPEKSRVTQVPILVLYQEEQGNRVTQVPVQVMYTPKPVPLPLPLIPEVTVSENWGWKTTINASHVGQEQRSRLRSTPRITQQITLLTFNDEDRVLIYNMLMRYLKTPFTYPLYQYNARLTQAALVGDTKLFCNTAKTDVRAGETVALVDPRLDETHYLTCTTVDSDGVNLSAPLEIDAPMNWQVCPAIPFRIQPVVGLSMNSIDGSITLTMESLYPRVFQRPGAAPTLTTIEGILIVPEPYLTNDEVKENFNHGLEWFDNGTSIPEILNEWSNPHVEGSRQYMFDRKVKMDYWRAVCDVFKGTQGIGLFPTFRDDLKLRDAMALGATTFTTDNINFYKWWLDLNYKYIAIYTANGAIYRRVIDVDPHYDANGDPYYLTVKLATAIGGSAGDNVISAISYMNLCRLDTDDIKLTHSDIDTLIDFTIKAVDK